MNEITFRLSTLEDYGGIVKMSEKLYGGQDAIQEIYPDLMAEPSFHGVVGESNSEIVAFGGAFVLHGGRKLYSFGGRVRPDWRGKRVYGELKVYLRTRLRQDQFPLLTQEEFFTHPDNPALQSLLHSETYHLIFKRWFKFFNLTTGKLSCSLKGKTDVPGIRTESVGTSGLFSILSDPKSCRQVLSDRLFSGLLMFDPVVENFPLIERTAPAVVVSYLGPSILDGLVVLSTGRKHRSRSYVIQFHYDSGTTISPSILAQHVVLHIKKHIEVAVGLKQYRGCCLSSPEAHFKECLNMVDLSGFEEVKIFVEPMIYGFCRDI